MNYVAKEVHKVLYTLNKLIEKYQPIYPLSEPLKRGLQISKQVCEQEEFVHPTPIMKNAMIIYGDVKQVNKDGEWHTERFPANGELGTAATTLLNILKVAMEKELGPETHDYSRKVPFTDPSYYLVDCWNFYSQLEKKFWDIQPKQEEQLRERYKVYSNPRTNKSIPEVLKLIEKSPAMQRTLEIENKIWPTTRASRDITSISDPFMAKKTGVSYPDYANDARKVPKTDMTYGRYEIELAKQAHSKGMKSFLKFIYDNSVYTAYTRRQMGKGRALIAQSRRSNVAINVVNGPEMENVKETKVIQIPFLDEEKFLEELSKLAQLALDYNLYPVNIDASAWDQNLGAGWLALQDAERYVLAQGEYSKSIVEARTICNSKGYLVDGPMGKAHMIYGRQFSGYIDTTLGNSKANRTTATFGAIESNPHYVRDVIGPMKGYHIITLGDDLLIVLQNPDDAKPFINVLNKTVKHVIHEDEKYAEGVFFLQWRVFQFEGKWVMAYNVPRVFRSMLSKEDAKHLGRGGWTLAYYQQLGKLVRYPKALKIVLNILAAFDQYHLSLDLPVSDIIKMVQEEDQEAAKKTRNKTGTTPVTRTVERMFHANPNIQGVVEKDGKLEFDENYFVRIQTVFKEVYDPDYLPKLGFANPDLSKIK